MLATVTIAGLLSLGIPTAAFAAPASDPATPPNNTQSANSNDQDQQGENVSANDSTPTPSASPTSPADNSGTLKSSSNSSQDVSVQAVPAPTAQQSVVTVKVGDTRNTGTGGVNPLQGLILGLYAAATGDDPALFTCTSDSNGDCSFTVPNTQQGGPNYNKQFWVRQISQNGPPPSPPTGYFLNNTLRTGDAFGTSNTEQPYRFQTPKLTGGNTYRSGTDFMTNTGSNATDSGGTWQVSRDNDGLVQQCGLEVALVLDLSGSVGSSLSNLKGAANTLVDSLTGTPSQVGLFTFASAAPANNSNNQNRPITPVSTAASANTVKGWINGLTAPSDGNTNWDRGLAQVAASGTSYDVAIVITDGNPNVYGNPTTGNSNTRLISMENAIFSANAVKAKGTRIVAMGVGSGVSAPEAALNLSAISGKTKYNGSNSATADYYQTTDYAAAGAALKELALGNCKGSVSVVKQVIPQNGTIADAQPAGGWQMATSNPSSGITFGTPNPANGQTAAGTGSVSFPLVFAGGTTSGNVTIRETQQSGYSLVQADGSSNAICKNISTGANVPITNAGTTDQPGFQVGVSSTAPISCTIYNKVNPPQATVKVNKTWVVNGVTTTNPPFPAGFQANLNLAAPGNGKTWGDVISGYTAGGGLTVAENGVVIPTLCQATSTSFSKNAGGATINATTGVVTGLTQGANEFTITNTVNCSASLTLVKKVINNDGGTNVPTDWNGRLKAGTTTFNTGVAQNVAAGSYVLSEDQLPGYTLTGIDCVGGSYNPTTKTITLTGNQSATCTFTNDDNAPTLQLKKNVAGSSVPNTNWVLKGLGNAGSTVTNPAGGNTDAVAVKGGEKFTLSETALNYGGLFDASLWTCDNGVTVTAGITSAIPLGKNVICQITNTAKPAVVTHEKTLTDVQAQPNGSWNLSYQVAVTNTSPVAAGTYSLNDTLQFGSGVNVTPGSAHAEWQVSGAPSWTPIPTWNGAGNTTLAAAGTAIGVSGVQLYRITVNATLGSNYQPADCSVSGDQGPFSNKATLNGQVNKFACGTPALPSVTKDPGSATAVAGQPGQWDVTYGLSVKNTSDKQVYYNLSDLPTMPTGVNLISGPTLTPTGSTPPGLQPLPLSQVALPANTTHTFSVAIRVGVTDTATSDGLTCSAGPGHGAYNLATMTSSGKTFTDDACVSIPVPTITQNKTVSSVTQNPDGTWNVVYKIDVKNTSDTPGTYSLSDHTAFGAGITYPSSGSTSVTGPVPTIPNWNGLDKTGIVSNVPLAGQASQSFTVTINNISVAQGVIGSPAAVCPTDTKNGGFNNVGVITVAGVSSEDTACAPPLPPTVTKDFVSSTQQSPGSDDWTVVYTLTVKNSSSYGLYYTLNDKPEFSSDAQIVDWTVTRGGDTIVPTGPYTAPGTIIGTPRAIPAGATEVYTAAFTVSVPANPVNAECVPGTPGHGFFNAAALSSGNYTDSSSTCGPIINGGVPSISKSVVSTTQNVGGSWTIVYDVVVTGNPSHATSYSLTDRLDFGDGIDINSAAWTGESSGTWPNPQSTPAATFATNKDIGIGATQTYTVTVNATVDEGTFVNNPSQVLCTPGQGVGDGTGFLNRSILSSGRAADQQATACSEPSRPLISKTVTGGPTPVSGSDPLQWTVDYQVKVQNSSASQALLYSLNDSTGFSSGVTINSATVTSSSIPTNPSWNGGGDPLLVQNVSLPGGATQLFNIRVTFHTDPNASSTTFNCGVEQSPGNGLFNGAVVASGSDSYNAHACADVPVTLLVHKIWNLNGQDYPLVDAPDYLKNLAILKIANNTSNWSQLYDGFKAGSSVGLDEQVGQVPATCEFLGATGIGNVNLSKARNEFTITNRVSCPADISITKTLDSSAQQSNGTWNNTYTVKVSNSSTVTPITYDLSDTLANYGAGITINSASWTGQTSGSWTSLPGNKVAQLASDMVIPGTSTSGPQTYTVTVNATVTGQAWTDGTTACQTGDQPGPGGFRNVASATANGETKQATACGAPALTEVSKEANGPAELQVGGSHDGEWKITYDLDVSNAGANPPLYYDLSDTPKFPNGVTLTTATATNDAGIDTSGWNGSSVTQLVSGKQILPGSTHTFTITAYAKVADTVDNGNLVCNVEKTGGFLNTAIMTNGTVEYPTDACTDIPMGRLTLAKHVDNSAFTGLDTGGHALGIPANWTLKAQGEQDTFTTPGSETGVTKLVPEGNYTLSEQTNSDNPFLHYYTEGSFGCSPAENGVTATVQAGVTTSCQVTNTGHAVDLKIVKKDGGVYNGQPAVPTDVNAEYDYTFTISNASKPGTPDVNNVVMTDTIPNTIRVAAPVAAPTGWTAALSGQDGQGFGGVLTLTKNTPFKTGDPDATFTIRVQTASALPREGGNPTSRILDIVNTAVVSSDGVDSNPADNTSTVNTPVKSLAVAANAICMNDAAYADYSITPYNMAGLDAPPVVMIWWTPEAYANRDPSIPAGNVAAILANGASQVNPIAVGNPFTASVSGTQPWPGVVLDGNGNPVAWPGWTLVDGTWVLDPSAPFSNLRGDTVVEFRVNPSTAATVVYPPASPDCNPNPVNSSPGATTASSGSRMASTGFDALPLIASGILLLLAGALAALAGYLIRRRREFGEDA